MHAYTRPETSDAAHRPGDPAGRFPANRLAQPGALWPAVPLALLLVALAGMLLAPPPRAAAASSGYSPPLLGLQTASAGMPDFREGLRDILDPTARGVALRSVGAHNLFAQGKEPAPAAESRALLPSGAAAAGDEYWDARFGARGPGGAVEDVAVGRDGLYVGGSFRVVGSLPAANVAKWDGQTWHALGEGIDGDVLAIAVSGGDVYVGGRFTTAGGVSARHVARWDGSTWHPLGEGVDWVVHSITISGGDVYVGGQFTTAGGISAGGIARWDGRGWHALGGGVSGRTGHAVQAIAVSGRDVYVGGQFTMAGGVSASNIARWDGSNWHPLGGGFDLWVRDLALDGDVLYAGGAFTHIGTMPAARIARWDGSAWHALGAGLNRGEPYVADIEIVGHDVYVGGGFDAAGFVQAPNLARWDGTEWHAVGGGVRGGGSFGDVARALAFSDGQLYVGGTFSQAGPLRADNLARWDGGGWQPLVAFGEGVVRTVYTLAAAGREVYAGGNFVAAGDALTYNIARWDGGDWHPLGAGIAQLTASPAVASLVVSGTDLYVGGDFYQPGPTDMKNVARWDGDGWRALGTGVAGPVGALALARGDLYAGGSFNEAGDVRADNIARWDGRAWHPVGGGIDGWVRALAVSGGDVYVGGQFTTAGGISALNVARWDGTSWHPLGGGVDGSVSSIAVSGGDVYVGGQFTTAGGISALNVARWDGTNWHPLGSGLLGFNPSFGWVDELLVVERSLYAAGRFSRAGGVAANNLAFWDGSNWHALGSGTDGPVWALAGAGGDLYVGGTFTFAGSKPAMNFSIRHAVAPVPFWDVPAHSYFYNPVQELVGRGALSGYSTSPPCPTGQVPCFNPFANTTRAQAVKIVVAAAGLPIRAPASPTFADVPPIDPFYAFIETAVANNIVAGYDDPTHCAPGAAPCFRPAGDVTRAQLAKIVVAAARWEVLAPATATFVDVPPGSAYYGVVETAYRHGVISGYSCGSGCLEFRPGNPAVRAHVAKMVYLALSPAAAAASPR